MFAWLTSLVATLTGACGAAAGGRNVSPDEFEKIMSDAGVVVLDVRTARELSGGRIKGALHLDFHAPDFKQKLAGLDKGKSYLVYCASGVRSAKACSAMAAMEFASVVNLKGGIMAWRSVGKTVEK